MGANPHKNKAGKVKIMPLAMEEEAEPIVWLRLASRILEVPPNLRMVLNAATVITATGIEVLIVKPALNPR